MFKVVSKKQRVLQLVSEGYSHDKIRILEGISRQKLRRWLEELEIAGNNPDTISDRAVRRGTSLSKGQVDWLYFVLTSKSAGDFSATKALWSPNYIHTIIRKWCRPDFPLNKVHLLLKDFGFLFRNFLKDAMGSDVISVKNWLRQDFELLKTRAVSEAGRMFVVDELFLKDTFAVVENLNDSRSSYVVQKDGPLTGMRVIYSTDLRKPSVLFQVTDTKDRLASDIDFLRALAATTKKPTYVIVRRQSSFSRAPVQAYVRKELTSITLITIPFSINS
jgi:hypothetical protein